MKTTNLQKQKQERNRILMRKVGMLWALEPTSLLSELREKETTLQNSEFGSVAQLCPTLCDPVECSMPGFPVHHKLLKFTQTHAH